MMGAGPHVKHGVVGLLVALAVVVFAVTGSAVVADVCYLGVMIGASVGAVMGAARAPFGRRLVPLLIALGVVLTAMRDLVWVLLDLRDVDTDVSLADPLWFTSYFVLIIALVTDAAWMVATVMLAYAAWHQSDVEAQDDAHPSELGGWVVPLIIAVLPLLVPPALKIAAELRGEPDEPFELVVGMLILILIALAFVRTWRSRCSWPT